MTITLRRQFFFSIQCLFNSTHHKIIDSFLYPSRMAVPREVSPLHRDVYIRLLLIRISKEIQEKIYRNTSIKEKRANPQRKLERRLFLFHNEGGGGRYAPYLTPTLQ